MLNFEEFFDCFNKVWSICLSFVNEFGLNFHSEQSNLAKNERQTGQSGGEPV